MSLELLILSLAALACVAITKSHKGDKKSFVSSSTSLSSSSISRPPMNITAVSGVSVDLRCKVRLHDCGNFFNIQWYKEMTGKPSERVYIYIHQSAMVKSEHSWKRRANHTYDSKRHVMKVELSETQLSDEALYRCEITYEESGRWFKGSCYSSQFSRLTVLQRPRKVKLELENGTEIQDGAVIGPFNEGAVLELKCTASSAKPIPQVVS